jgi:hypothetical protein
MSHKDNLYKAVMAERPAVPRRTDDLFDKARELPPEEFRKEFNRRTSGLMGFSAGSWRSVWNYLKKAFSHPS